MGGSFHYNGGGHSAIDLNSYCKSKFKFQIILDGNMQMVWNKIKIDDEVAIEVEFIDDLPKLWVLRIKDKLRLGLVPAEYSRLFDCIDNGWHYAGKIIDIAGDELQPLIYVIVWGQKDM
ncbi:hypothetical protein EDC21_12327 [Thermohydrogenium kirishiense]|nr:hypothetical protein EDC21_12327 [Thermohydrogenium kirishiense]